MATSSYVPSGTVEVVPIMVGRYYVSLFNSCELGVEEVGFLLFKYDFQANAPIQREDEIPLLDF